MRDPTVWLWRVPVCRDVSRATTGDRGIAGHESKETTGEMVSLDYGRVIDPSRERNQVSARLGAGGDLVVGPEQGILFWARGK